MPSITTDLDCSVLYLNNIVKGGYTGSERGYNDFWNFGQIIYKPSYRGLRYIMVIF